MPIKDPEKKKAYQREYYRKRLKDDPVFRARHAELVKVSSAKARRLHREIVIAFKSFGCANCDEREPSCLDAHHVDPSGKDFQIGDASSGFGVGVDKLKAELAKCICLCANCHRKFHAGVIEL